MSEKKNTGKKAVIAVIVIALIVVIIALVAVISGKSKKGGSKSATEAGTEAGSETMRSGQFDIDYAKQVTKLADYSGIAITVSNDYEINDTAKQKYLTNVLQSYGADAYKQVTDRDTVADGDYAGDGNNETVLTVKCTASVNWSGLDGNRWQVNIALRTSTGVAPYAQGWGYATVNPKFVEEYEDGDTRRTASVIDIKGEGLEDNQLVQTCIVQSQEYTGYYIKKYAPLAFADGTHAGMENGTGNLMISNHQDYVQVRYADVLLMAAELGSPNAQQYFNMVRERAFKDKDGNTSPLYTEKQATKENIMRERQFEFAFEGINYYDLLRQGIDYAAAQLAKQNGVEVMTAGAPATISFNPQNFINKAGLMMVNTNQILLSDGVLKQNPGW